MSTRRLIIPWLLCGALVAPRVARAQEPQPQPQALEQEKARQFEAQRRVEEAQKALAQALKDLQAAQGEQAGQSLREALERVREAQRELRADTYRDIISRAYIAPRGEASVIVATERRPRMGVVLKPSGAADSLGAVVQGITPGGPAEEAGLKAGDIILKANGQSLARSGRRGEAPDQRLVAIIRELEAGDTLRVEYRRGSETKTVSVVVREIEPAAYTVRVTPDSMLAGRYLRGIPEMEFAVPTVPNIAFESPERLVTAFGLPFGWLDMELVTLNEGLGEYFGTTEGLLVVRAPKQEELDLKSGDVILSIDGRKPTTPVQALRIMRSYEPGETMNIEVMRAKRRQTITVTVPETKRGFLWQEENRQ